jgi:hypothetical protein
MQFNFCCSFAYIATISWQSSGQVPTMKHADFGDVFKLHKCSFFMFCVPQEFKFPPKSLGYLTDYRWGAPTLLT